MKKPVKIPTATFLANVALHYLSKFAASEASLRRVLENKMRRAAMQHPDFAADTARQAELRGVIETIIETHKRTGILNDAVFAAGKVNSLRRQGRSGRLIRQKLAHKGIAADIVETALSEYNDGAEPADVDLAAARAFARRRKLGPYRTKAADDKQRHKDIAALARGGFSFTIIRQILDAEDIDTLGDDSDN